MGSIVRALVVYGFLLLIFRITGKRALAHVTTFDAVLLLIISEAIQQGLIDGDESMSNAFLLVVALLGADIVLSVISVRSNRVDKLLNGVPLLLMEDGTMHHDRLKKARVTPDDILERARELQGIERLDQIKYAVLERSGAVTIVPREGAITFAVERQ